MCAPHGMHTFCTTLWCVHLRSPSKDHDLQHFQLDLCSLHRCAVSSHSQPVLLPSRVTVNPLHQNTCSLLVTACCGGLFMSRGISSQSHSFNFFCKSCFPAQYFKNFSVDHMITMCLTSLGQVSLKFMFL